MYAPYNLHSVKIMTHKHILSENQGKKDEFQKCKAILANNILDVIYE